MAKDRSDQPRVRTTISLPVTVHELLSIGAILKNAGMSEIAEQAVLAWFNALPHEQKKEIHRLISARSVITASDSRHIEGLLKANLEGRAAVPPRPRRKPK